MGFPPKSLEAVTEDVQQIKHAELHLYLLMLCPPSWKELVTKALVLLPNVTVHFGITCSLGKLVGIFPVFFLLFCGGCWQLLISGKIEGEKTDPGELQLIQKHALGPSY